MDERPWFLPVNSSRIPILIGEVADPAFATRIRQTISTRPQSHIPRTAYPADDLVPDCAIPKLNHVHARVLLKTALAYFDGRYHIVRKSATWALFEKYIQAPASLDPLSKCKIFALFAFGELCSSQGKSSSDGVPGMAFFKEASKAYGVLHERPTTDYVETCLILALYSLHVNRRHSAYFLASSAIRHCIVMGLHFNVPDSQIHDAGTREHLNRLWWTSYLLDHQCATISSQAISVSDEEIFVDLPKEIQLPEPQAVDFQCTDSLASRISLARLTNKIIRTLYGRSTYSSPFLGRAQSALKDLRQWYRIMPESLRATADGSYRGPATMDLHLSFNQCLILTTRPVLLYVTRVRMTAGVDSPSMDHLHTDTRTLAEACIQCARDSFNIITEAWSEGSVRTFDCFTTQQLFSAATILAIASLLTDSPEEDRQKFEFASHLLESLRDAGNYPARHYCQHLDGIKSDIQSLTSAGEPCPSNNDAITEGPHSSVEAHQNVSAIQPRASIADVGPPLLMTQQAAGGSSAVFMEPSMGAFLSQDEFYPAQLDEFLTDTQMQGIYWPNLDSDLDTTY
ncbi:hypothetical protein BO86DRAFT_397346 [Aspergillus japonicus CBS 114.51]|uniref:Xylanolytic transcriptional activator regulatory domain-containing protein n=1 Tax=Aspergillus japonicus CBS 114.51 TaxID=1448312 RepID=A0A8T8X8L7_ASPJA|nr:hypothetical protein BO86DRAFT_397346 [Aspergillus japonicus CBS 114.51]RAH84513.1 hypothetical protein BO86DRAFT_397346 [Aspergillus japonicus CBS 114.51]